LGEKNGFEKEVSLKKFKMIILWILVISLCITIYNYGKTKYYWYEDTKEPGWGYYKESYHGKDLGNLYKDSEKYKYVEIVYKFDKDTEVRTIIIILILAVSSFLSFKINKI